jgi:ribosomal protein L37E
MPDSTYFEVRCERCKTSFALGTRNCVHCGGALGRRLLAFDALSAARAGSPPTADMQPSLPDAQPNIGRWVRIALIGLGVLAALARMFLEDR